MGGFPVTRTASADGRWAYTLYDGGEHPFVHALDTSGRTARCIDLDSLAGRNDISSLKLRLAPGGGRLTVVAPEGVELADVSTTTFAVSSPATRVHAAPRQGSPAEPGRPPWALAALIAAALIALAGLAMRQRVFARGAGAR
jgi:hypothetical protein